MSHEVTIRALTHKGDGVADGPVYVPQVLPGEVVSGDLEGQRLANTRIITPSADRVTPPCRHFKSCGGCQFQHASDAFTAAWKKGRVERLLADQRLETDLLPMHVSPPRSRRRATLAARRSRKGAIVGFHARASDAIVEIPDCQLLRPELMEAIPLAERLAILGASRKQALSVSLTLSHAGVDVAVRQGKPLDRALRQELAQAASAYDVARLSWGDETVAMRRPPFQQFGAARVVPPPGAFLQATADGEAALCADVKEFIGQGAHVVDIFAGCGTFSLPLASASRVHAVEGDHAMLQALDQGWRKAMGLRAVSFEPRDLFRRPLEPDELARFDAAVYDPPRARATAQVERLAASRLERIAYVSCNPDSFARDARMLVDAGFRLECARLVDQFRWSAHVELVAKFTR